MDWMHRWPECTGCTYRHSEWMGSQGGWGGGHRDTQGASWEAHRHPGCMGRTQGHTEPAWHGHTETEGAGCRQTDGRTPSTDSVAKSLAVSRFFLTATIIQRWQKR